MMFKSILVPVDITVPGDMAKLLSRAGALKDTWGSEVHVVSVMPDPGFALVSQQLPKGLEHEARAGAKGSLQAALKEAGLSAELHIQMGTIYDQVIKLAEQLDIDLIVIGAHQTRSVRAKQIVLQLGPV
ncbi:MAG: universal stress protein, partial [Pseudomonadota bacterium]